MLAVITALATVAGVVFIVWIIPIVEYMKIGSYDNYKSVSEALNNKELEYARYQVNGFKNVDFKAIDYLYQISRACTEKDLGWLTQCKEFIEQGLVEAGEKDASKFSISKPFEEANRFEILRVIKRSRIMLPDRYQGMGCSTCGESVVMEMWVELRIRQIKSGENIKPGDLDYVIEAVNEIKKYSK